MEEDILTELCMNCKADWKPNENDVCSFCGHSNHTRVVTVHDAVHMVESDHVQVIPRTEFDLNLSYSGKTIIEVSRCVDDRLIEYFQKHPEELKKMDRRLFEELVAEIFRGFGCEIEMTKQTRDCGKDIIAIKRDEVESKYLIECKRPDPGGYVNVRAVRELYGVKTSEKATKGIIVTTAYLSPDAKSFIQENRWELEGKEYEDIKQWLAEYSRLQKNLS